MYEHLGKTLLCKAYYKKAKDGIHIMCYDKDGQFCSDFNKIEKAYAYDRHGEETELFFEGDGVEKKLRELIEGNWFAGVCVGETVLPITEYLYTDVNYHYNGEEYYTIGKEIRETCECYIVYYANNRKRYVPKDCCEFLKGGDE